MSLKMFIIILKDDVMKTNNILKKSLLSSMFFVILVVIVFYFVFKDLAFKDVLILFKNSNKLYLIIAVLCMASYSFLEGVNVKIILKSLGNKIKYSACYKYAVGSFFTASITPSSSGGDPMALFLMARDKIPVSHSAITLLTKLMCYQIVVLSLSLISFITTYKQTINLLGNMKFLVFLGLFLNSLVFSLYFLAIFFKQIMVFLVDLLCKLLYKLHFKKAKRLEEKIHIQIEEYSSAALILKNNKKIVLKVVLVTLVQIIIFYSIPYFVYLALGYHETSILKFITTQAILYVAVSALPFPGAVGISEAVFMKLYKTLFNPLVLGSAMFITRFINFYLFVIITGLLLAIFITKDNFKKVKSEL